MGFYADRVFPRLMDWGMRGLGELRQRTLADARGDVLEIGFGTGRNLAYYPAPVRRVVGLDPLTALQPRVAARIGAAPFPVERVALPADGPLPFDDERFDTVVTTWTLCSIPDAAAALAEMRRVLKPEGLYLFVEHGRSDDPATLRRQEFWNPLHRRIAGGCQLQRPIDRVVGEAGFSIERLTRYVHPGGPRIFSEMYEGAARP
jgi:SAM-dependent methyltransferase